jgi:hypothetical protein
MTRATDSRPTRRVLITIDGVELVVELRRRSITVRPLGSRRGGPAEVELTPGSIYLRALMDRIDQERREKMARRKHRRRRR